jgi:lysyl-tRNA synthetase class 2
MSAQPTTTPARPADAKRARVPVERRLRRRWVPRTASLLAGLIGLIDIGSALTPAVRSRVESLTTVVPGALTHAAAALTVVTGVLLLLLAHALRRRKRRAWRAVVVLLAASVVLHVVKGLDVEEAVIAFLLLVALVVARSEFYATGDPRTRVRAIGMLFVLLVADLVLGLAVVWLRAGHIVGSHPLSAEVQHVVYGLVGVTGPLRFRVERSSDVVAFTLLALGLLTVLVTAYLMLRPYEPVPTLMPDDEARMRDLLVKQGRRDSLGYFALRRDKNVVWSPTGKACVAYRVVSGVMLASGDPIGDPEAWPGAIAEFLREADVHAWVPAVIGCSEAGGEVWAREANLEALELGDEAIVDTAEFTLDGRAMRNVRQMVARVERNGYTAVVRRARDVTAAEVAEIRRVADAWRGAETERGFSMALGRFGDPADGDCVVATAHDADGDLRAVLHFAPWGEDGLSLDLMRRDRTADPGLNEFLIVAVLRQAGMLGVDRVSLNFAVFRSALERGERLGAGPVTRVWRNLLVFASRWFQIESLYRFNAKFRPIWEPRFICFPGVSDLPRIAIAALEAEAFLVWPRPSLRWLRRFAGVHPA